jgi:plasmid stabilization system protein ParE
VKVVYRKAASDDVARQFRYYLVDQNLTQIALRFRDAVRNTMDSLRDHPLVGPAMVRGNPSCKTCDHGP